ncbi:hypothetical protein [Achromobacter aloeverae]|uniref:Uncharacterized protein n=1 Tax=Achromobacter aloeverae TaxID=1750518 RepID=A0A4Q1HCX0_9BURK|nr:hypothetical protein [Achromobacter aloeverae]RXN83655.1 hypothetical protein C7R54_25585 [Achromobacter aloeverae]
MYARPLVLVAMAAVSAVPAASRAACEAEARAQYGPGAAELAQQSIDRFNKRVNTNDLGLARETLALYENTGANTRNVPMVACRRAAMQQRVAQLSSAGAKSPGGGTQVPAREQSRAAGAGDSRAATAPGTPATGTAQFCAAYVYDEPPPGGRASFAGGSAFITKIFTFDATPHGFYDDDTKLGQLWKSYIKSERKIYTEAGCIKASEYNDFLRDMGRQKPVKVVEWTPAAAAGIVARQHRDALSGKYGPRSDTLRAANDAASQQGSGGRKRVVLKNLGKQCIKPTDIRMDRDVKGMYWYKMQNTCSQALLVSWCDFNGGKPCVDGTNSAWNIRGGESYEAWADVDPKDGRFHLRWSACEPTANGREVYYDKRKDQCWTWSE